MGNQADTQAGRQAGNKRAGSRAAADRQAGSKQVGRQPWFYIYSGANKIEIYNSMHPK